ncbi:hypothetical protein JAAARDRAFT_660903 [Jaapia argillacea MUCL 33604]|uniref:Uncharacterized protein n=1 Tax=Jaapia argillacea MUCL 33604 TaxID=933084 RepID=A0A067PFS4_9AGAM|nr:hypothetical protein JAAARDRAFT_660903 [Jaapia argillacea MUCL 33604]
MLVAMLAQYSRGRQPTVQCHGAYAYILAAVSPIGSTDKVTFLLTRLGFPVGLSRRSLNPSVLRIARGHSISPTDPSTLRMLPASNPSCRIVPSTTRRHVPDACEG